MKRFQVHNNGFSYKSVEKHLAVLSSEARASLMCSSLVVNCLCLAKCIVSLPWSLARDDPIFWIML